MISKNIRQSEENPVLLCRGLRLVTQCPVDNGSRVFVESVLLHPNWFVNPYPPTHTISGTTHARHQRPTHPAAPHNPAEPPIRPDKHNDTPRHLHERLTRFSQAMHERVSRTKPAVWANRTRFTAPRWYAGGFGRSFSIGGIRATRGICVARVGPCKSRVTSGKGRCCLECAMRLCRRNKQRWGTATDERTDRSWAVGFEHDRGVRGGRASCL